MASRSFAYALGFSAVAAAAAAAPGRHAGPRAEEVEAARLGLFPFFVPDISGLQLPLASADGAAKPPKIMPQWSSALIYDGDMMNIPFTDGRGTFLYDRDRSRYRTTYEVKDAYFNPGMLQFRDQVAGADIGDNMTWGRDDDGVCMPWGHDRPYSDLFAWVSLASRAGQKNVGGETCSVWTWYFPSYGLTSEICVGADGLPREMNQTFGAGGKWNGGNYMQFLNFTVGDPGDEAFVASTACATNWPSQPCEDEKVVTMDTYRIWAPPEPLELANRNTGDVLGDLSFVCTQGSGPMYRSKLITYWQVNVSTTFGQYALCNYDGTGNVCGGPPVQLARVGRRSGQMSGKGPRMGQCSPNDDAGSQYSFPGLAQCPPGVVPGSAAGCTWTGAVPVRTIKASCIMEERGLLEACSRDIGHAPFKEAAAVWLAAFATDDPYMGGCPDVPSAESDIVVLV